MGCQKKISSPLAMEYSHPSFCAKYNSSQIPKVKFYFAIFKMQLCGCFKKCFRYIGKVFRFVGKALNSPIFFEWLTLGFLFFILVAMVDFGTDVKVALDIASKQENYADMIQGDKISVSFSKHQRKKNLFALMKIRFFVKTTHFKENA